MSNAKQKWTSRQLLLEAQQLVAGQFGTEGVYKVLRQVRDDYEAALTAAEERNAVLRERVAELEEELEPQRLDREYMLDQYDAPGTGN